MRLVPAGAAVLAIASVASAAAQSKQTVLFVCEHGAAKSVVAAAHFNRLAEQRGLPFRAISRGTAPDATVPRRITDGLERDGARVPAGFAPTAVSDTDVAGAVRVITFDVTLPRKESPRVQQWNALPAFSDGYEPASRAILTKIEVLIRDLEKAAKPKGQ